MLFLFIRGKALPRFCTPGHHQFIDTPLRVSSFLLLFFLFSAFSSFLFLPSYAGALIKLLHRKISLFFPFLMFSFCTICFSCSFIQIIPTIRKTINVICNVFLIRCCLGCGVAESYNDFLYGFLCAFERLKVPTSNTMESNHSCAGRHSRYSVFLTRSIKFLSLILL
ncbi:hypothetical protein V8G54_031308 [Vigna mungo]|uniref:Uncharacterized protein n=1 Tax=Vigna mungo TaxID=3915 RepID=A0AAQ3MY28_VIGMU